MNTSSPYRPHQLDVGCGACPQGDVNIDLYPGHTLHDKSRGSLHVKHIQHFIKADALHLPFKNGAFEKVYSNQVLEHVSDPYLMLQELIRVSSKEVEIFTPYRLQRRRKYEGVYVHQCHFTKTWFRTAFKKLGLNPREYTVKYYDWQYLPHIFCPLIRLPYQLHVQVTLNTYFEGGRA